MGRWYLFPLALPLCPSIVNEITKLINFFINSQSWPQEWKCSIVNPVFKKDEDTNKANYRPISILSALSNAFQTSSVVEYVRSFNALMKMSEDWRKSLDKREAVVAVAMDLAKHLTQLITVYC